MSKILLDLQFAYAKVLSNIFNCWVHDDDGGCDQDAVGSRQVVQYNSVTVIYQPMKNDCWVEDSAILFMPAKESGIKFTEALFKQAKPFLEEVENKMIDSYNGYVSKFGHWIEVTQKSGESKPMNFASITDIFDPIKFDKGIFKFKWTVKALWSGPTYRWYPKELINWYQSLPAYKTYRESKGLKDPIQEHTYYIEEEDSYLEEWYIEHKSDTSGAPKTYCGSEKSERMVAKPITYEEAFPDRPKPVAGKKRKADTELQSQSKK